VGRVLTAIARTREFAMKNVLIVLCVSALLPACANLQRSRDLANRKVPPATTAVQVCSNCHGADGVSVSPNFPRLAGQPEGYLVKQLQDFRSHQRADPAGYEYMWGITRSMSDETIAGLAAYFSAQNPRANAPVDPALLPLGKKIFEEGVPDKETPPCFACHGPKAQGLAQFPRLAGQHKTYLVKQLHIFQETQMRPGTPMTQVTHLLSNKEMEAVAAYLQAFPDTP
jgi:cytochrome c553